jgi:predicted PurR-regulated permease PerM
MRWVLVLASVIALVFLVRAAPSILSVVLGGFALALVLSFLVRALGHFLPRGFAILITFRAFFGLIALVNATPTLATQADQLLRDILTPL